MYKKHHPPSLADEVWRLEKIGKDGAFHRRLSKERIKTVKDFLTLYFVDPARLRNVRIYWISLPYILFDPTRLRKNSDVSYRIVLKIFACLFQGPLKSPFSDIFEMKIVYEM